MLLCFPSTTVVTGVIGWIQDIVMEHIDGLVQERRNSIANALELHLSCTNPSIEDVILKINIKDKNYLHRRHFQMHSFLMKIYEFQ